MASNAIVAEFLPALSCWNKGILLLFLIDENIKRLKSMDTILLPKTSALLPALFLAVYSMQIDFTVLDAGEDIHISLDPGIRSEDAYRLGAMQGQMIKIAHNARQGFEAGEYFPAW